MLTKDVTAASGDRVTLVVRKGSVVAPLAFLLVTIILFIVYALPSGVDQLGANIGVPQSVGEPMTLDRVVKVFESDDTRNKLLDTVKGYGAWEFIEKIARPAAKAFLDQLIVDFGAITRSLIATVLQLGLFALIPGMAGLIYRRRFTQWFVASFGLLLAINYSGLFGSLTSARPMPGSGAIFFFLVSQIILLVLAYRLRRHAKSPRVLSPRIQNGLLASALVLVAVACWQGWGPGYGPGATPPAPTDRARSPGVQSVGAPGVGVPSVPDESLKASPPAAEIRPPAAAPPAAPVRTTAAPQESKAGSGSGRSWIWAFLGTGLIGWFYKWEFILLGLPVVYTLLRNSEAWTSRSPKNIVVCLDGTSNTPDQMEMGFVAQTNVFKLFNLLKADKQGMAVPFGQFDASLCKRYGEKQIAFYYAGVGNKYDSDPILQSLGMATGQGASNIVERAYLDLVRVYQPGDRIFIFGFSRGAAIARLLARTLDARGTPRSVWTLRFFGKHRILWTSARKRPAPIDVLGCWDTVGSFGIAKTIAGINFQQLNMFRDLTVPDSVAQAYHMVALDEQRAEFEPTLMDPDPIRPERIVEVWFAGDHANVGGGWATDKLSDITLDFLLSRISSGYARDGTTPPGDQRWGVYLTAVKIDRSAARSSDAAVGDEAIDPDPLGQVRQWFSNLYNYRPRALPLHAVISDTVFERMRTSIPSMRRKACSTSTMRSTQGGT